jgi:putative nucleotidyltransferase with HDIG domain
MGNDEISKSEYDNKIKEITSLSNNIKFEVGTIRNLSIDKLKDLILDIAYGWGRNKAEEVINKLNLGQYGIELPQMRECILNEEAVSDWEGYVNRNPMIKASIEILEKLNTKGKAYIVGGAVRDIVTGEKDPDDVDIATNVPIAEIQKMFETYDIGKAETFGIIGVKYAGHTFEVAQFRSDGAYLDGRRPEKVDIGVSFETDVERRDFTINAMGLDQRGNIIDHFSGMGDIKNKMLRTVGDPHKRFGEDYLRMLRAARFASRMGYEIHPETKAAMSAHSEKIKNIAPERIMKEIIGMAKQSGDRFAYALQILKDTGLLQHILPEVMEMEKYEHSPEYHPEGGVLQHTMEALKKNTIKDPLINLAILLHDVGKPRTHKKEGDKISYINHAEEGVEVINQIADRLKMDNKTREALIFSTVNHMKIPDMMHMSNNKVLNLIKHDHWEVLKNVAYADSAARMHLFDPEEWKALMDKIEQLTKEYEGKKSLEAIRKVVNGKWVMELRGIEKPSKEVGDIIQKTVDWIIENSIDIEDIDAIKDYILNIY